MWSSRKTKKLLITLLLLGLCLGLLMAMYNVFNRNFKIVWNSNSDSFVPQTKFLEVRPIEYGIPTPVMREAQAKGEIYLGGDVCFWCSKYAIMIKVSSK